MKKKVAIIGGGASGMMAAIAAAKNNNTVHLYEKNEKLGKKVLITGNGRCNLTNKKVSWKDYHGTTPKFVTSVFARFSNIDTITFFEDLGLVFFEEDRGRLFPRSNQAQTVVDVLEQELETLQVSILFNQKIKHIHTESNQFIITTYQQKEYTYDAVILATGGKSHPKTGSTGDGYRWAKDFGHTIIKPFPASTPLRISHFVCNKLQGIKIQAQLQIIHDNKIISDKTGELLFTHLGISAPVVLESSRIVSKILTKNPKENLSCTINFFPEYTHQELRDLIEKRIQQYPDRNIASQFIGLLPKRVLPALLKNEKIDPTLQSNQVSKKLLHRIIEMTTNYRLPIDDVLGWDTAQFTAGGISTKEIHSKTMESKIIKNLYLCGEVVDIDGNSGGYNLQWAWSSGYVAGSSV